MEDKPTVYSGKDFPEILLLAPKDELSGVTKETWDLCKPKVNSNIPAGQIIMLGTSGTSNDPFRDSFK